MSIIILYASIKRHSKQDPTIYFLKKLKYKDTNRLKVNGWTRKYLKTLILRKLG